jgi:hypothetical protein
MSCHSATANQVRLVLHTAASWLMMHGVRAAIPRGKVTGELIQAPLVWDTPRGLAASASSAGGIVSMSAATLPMPQDASGAMAPSTCCAGRDDYSRSSNKRKGCRAESSRAPNHD